MSQKLKEAIDKMVEDSIRRILPSVMNEVLIKVIASSSSPISEKRVVNQRQPKPPQQVQKSRTPALQSMLDEMKDEFLNENNEFEEHEQIQEVALPQKSIAQRINSLPPALRGVVEEMSEDYDSIGEMWDDNFASPVNEDVGAVRDPARAAASIGIDFSKMKNAIKANSNKSSNDDARNKAEFEMNRIKRLRESLEVKPGE